MEWLLGQIGGWLFCRDNARELRASWLEIFLTSEVLFSLFAIQFVYYSFHFMVCLNIYIYIFFVVIPSPEARQNLMKLAQRMIRTFSLNISTSGGQSWTALSDSPDDTVRITTRKIVEPGQPNGVILSAVSTTWLPYPHYRVFDLLRDERRRSQVL